jgi:hypothetical protein
MTKIILFTNSYFEYVKLKAFLEKVNASVILILSRPNTYANILHKTRSKVVLPSSTTTNSESS